MPPTLPLNDRDQDELPPLSDEDVSLLYHIVLRAQDQDEFKTRPKKAVFDAYDAIFAEHGLHTNHDRACLRLLFQLVGPGLDPRTSLYEKFEQLLARAGITLDHGDEEISFAPSGSPMLHETNAAGEGAGREERRALALEASPSRPERRNSFASMYDVTAEIERLSRRRTLSRASASHVEGEKSPFNGGYAPRWATPGPSRRKSHSSQDYSSPHTRSMERCGLNKRENEIEVPQGEDNLEDLAHGLSYGYSGTERSASSREEIQKDLGERVGALPVIPVSQTQLVRESGAFDRWRIRILAKNYLRKWRGQTIKHVAKYAELEADAAQRDRYTLQRQALDSWLAAHRRVQQEEGIKRHFNALERRAAEVYGGFLKAKAFRHWYSITLEAEAKTEAARQKYLYVKYFNAWHQLTVTNELKAERQNLKAHYQLLRKRAAQYYLDEVNALEFYCSNLTKILFWRWAFAYAGRKARKFRDTELIKRTMLWWRAKLKDREEQDHEATLLYECSTLLKTLQLWSTHTSVGGARNQQADAFRRQSLTRRTLLQWKLATQLTPLEGQVARMRDWRIARSNFSGWLLRVRMIFRADWVNTLRTKQNAFTSWNERLRREVVQTRINNRILAQAMYKWVIAQRAFLMIRIGRERMKRATFSKLLAGSRKHTHVLHCQEVQVETQRFARLARSTLECWKLQMNLNTARSQMAVEFHTPKIQQDILTAWRDQHEHVQKLEKWAKDANFYFFMVKSLRRWRDAASEAKKRRTNDAYKKMRRQVKMNLARKVLVRWRDRLDEIESLDERCERLRRSSDADLLRGLILNWHGRDVQREQAMADAAAQHDRRLLTNSRQAWIKASSQAANLQIQAVQFYSIHLSALCSANLRRLSMKAFGIRRRQQDAAAMRERHWAKHVRSILRHWATRSRDATYQALVQGSSEPTDAGYGTASQDDPPAISTGGAMGPGAPGSTQREVDWTAYEADLLDNDDWLRPSGSHEPARVISTAMPTPGYLNTPSKRAARAKALAKMSTTPATPLMTPFAARLRTGVASSPILFAGSALHTARKGSIGQSGLGLNVHTAKRDQADIGYEDR